ncbi:hypothetical protein D6C76_10707, partial [Aureobasidium pullulans]
IKESFPITIHPIRLCFVDLSPLALRLNVRASTFETLLPNSVFGLLPILPKFILAEKTLAREVKIWSKLDFGDVVTHRGVYTTISVLLLLMD